MVRVLSLTVWTRRSNRGNGEHNTQDTDVTCFLSTGLLGGATFGSFGGVSSLGKAGMMVNLTSC